MGKAATDLSNNPGAGGNTDAATFNDGTAGAPFDLTADNGVQTYIQARSLVLNPLFNQAWNNVANNNTRAVALDAGESDALIANANLNTAEAKHFGALLLAHLRLIKANSEGTRNQQLNLNANN